jgi:hypothetical protein
MHWDSFDNCPGGEPPSGDHKVMDAPSQGDSIRVVWTASSGGKTQTLFKYTVQ